MNTFKTAESAPAGASFELADSLKDLKFNEQGLIPAISQQFDTGEVLMMAWMNREALEETLNTARVCFYSRSRQTLWRKGETSGQVQHLKELRIDCDGDTILLMVDQTGPACHTGRRSCFYNLLAKDHMEVTSDPLISPEELYQP
ncbi:MAG: phosphoribosyl-AMP cyclohydrolase [Thiotrichales bacterium]